jgi:hypothetical protein
MKVKQVAKLAPIDRFIYWIEERHRIYKRRKAGQSKPWTDDEVLQAYFFTNPYRENDKVTVWFREKVRGPMRNEWGVMFATVCFRWFNRISTGEKLLEADLLWNWNRREAVKLLKGKEKVFTGAFMIPAVPGSNKVEHVCKCLQNIWKDRVRIVETIGGGTLQNAHKTLVQYPYLGGFMAYEVVTDLRYTYLLNKAKDRLNWCNPGPGCARGLLRLQGVDLKSIPASHGCKPPKNYLDLMQELRIAATEKLPYMPRFEMREIEHSLCEWDKYERARLVDGRLKRRYKGV